MNDGSPDDSLAVALALARTDPRIRIVDLSRNFGHHAAALAGLRHARGELIFLIDVDLEEQPEWLLDFWRDLHDRGADVVYGVQETRSGSMIKRHTGSLFYALFNFASETTIPANVCTVRLMRRSYVDAIGQFTEAHLYLAGIYAWTGFVQYPRLVNKTPRPTKSSYTLLRRFQLFVNATTSFSSYPLTIIFFVGICLTFLSVTYGAWLLFIKLLYPNTVLSGFTSIMVSLWFLGGTVLSFLGLIGIYVGKIFVETKARPQYLVRHIYKGSNDNLQT